MEIPRTIISEHHRGRKMPISYILSSLSSQEGCDCFEHDVMHAASEYIKDLEEIILFYSGLGMEKAGLGVEKAGLPQTNGDPWARFGYHHRIRKRW